MNALTAVVLAGGAPDAVAALQPGIPNKAFLSIAGITLVARTIAGLRAAPSVGRIVVVAPVRAREHPALAGSDEFRADGARISESLRSGLADFDPERMLLVTASDLPVLDGAAVEDFIQRACATDADIGYGCVERRTHLAQFPHVPHTWAHLRDGTYCGGGLIAIKPRALPRLEGFIERLGAARKNPLRLASLFGWDMLARYALRRLSIAQCEARASVLIGAPARAIISPFAQTGVNVDRPSDVKLAEELVGSHSGA